MFLTPAARLSGFEAAFGGFFLDNKLNDTPVFDCLHADR
jgi:hypothetical protein